MPQYARLTRNQAAASSCRSGTLATRDALFDVVAQGGLVTFDRQQIVGPMFEHQKARAVSACVCKASCATRRSFKSNRPKNSRATEISLVLASTSALPTMLASQGHGAHHRMARPLFGLLAVDRHQVSGGGVSRTLAWMASSAVLTLAPH